MSGYQEVITDPSYAGQVIAFTSSHIGNYGIECRGRRSRRPALPRCRGLRPRPRAVQLAGRAGPGDLLVRHGIPALTGVDTRRLTRHVRRAGAIPCAFGTAPEDEFARRRGGRGRHRRARPRQRGHSRAAEPATRRWAAAHRRLRLRRQGHHGATPRHARHGDGGARGDDGRRGALAPTRWRVPLQRPGRSRRAAGPRRRPSPTWWGGCPIFGICLGHQILATALGGSTYKLPFGHHGANHPGEAFGTGRSRSRARTTTTPWRPVRSPTPRRRT